MQLLIGYFHEIYNNLTPWQISQVARHPQRPYTLDYISNISDELEVNLILLGMPFLLSGSYGEQAKKVKKFATELRKKVSIKVDIIDERFSSVEAKRRLIENTSKKSKSRLKNLDSAAAAVMLQSYLDFSNKV